MPYCEVITTKKVDRSCVAEYSHALAEIIEMVPGKSERWVMVHIEDEAKMAFAGADDEPAAMITLKTFGDLDSGQYDMLTREFCAAAERLLSVPADRVYVVYEPIVHWGWNGDNF